MPFWRPEVKKSKLPASFASDYIKTVHLLSRKHKDDDAAEVKKILKLLDAMSQEAYLAGRGEVWIPQPSARTGYYPILEKLPYTLVRRAIRANTSSAERERSWDAIATTAEPFLPLFARRPGTLDEAQRKRFLEHILVALPFVKGRTPALLGKRVPGDLDIASTGVRTVVPVERLSPEDWKRGFTMRKFGLSQDVSASVRRMAAYKPTARVPKVAAPKLDVKQIIKRATDAKPKLEPEQRDNYIPVALIQQPLLSREEKLCYEDGVRDWFEKQKRRAARLWRRGATFIKRDVAPTAIRGATVGVAELAHTEIGLTPKRVDLIPVRRIGFKPTLQQYPSRVLRQIQDELRQGLVAESDLDIRKALARSLGDIAAELQIRGLLV